jgi:hypothetical protein
MPSLHRIRNRQVSGSWQTSISLLHLSAPPVPASAVDAGGSPGKAYSHTNGTHLCVIE